MAATAACILAFEITAILLLTHGHVLYSQDDAYIHLALARHLADKFHYGINAAEVSSPSSSILYPFLLALGLKLGLGASAALLLCVAGTVATTLLTYRILLDAGYRLDKLPNWACACLTALFLIGTNLVGAALTGMEHALQIALSLATISGAQRFLMGRQTGRLWIICAAICPLLRYEGVSLWLYIVVLLACHGYWRAAWGLAITTVSCLAAFSFWLHSNGLPLLPSSVLSKGGVAGLEGGGVADKIAGLLQGHLRANLAAPGFTILLATAVFCIAACVLALRQRKMPQAWIAGLGAFVGTAHLVIGSFGNVGRYEAYAVCTTIVCGLASAAWLLSPVMQRASKAYIMIAASSCMLALNSNLLLAIETPLAARNIYDQQFQMQRFVRTFWNNPVGVNDIGLVSYGTDAYVLDLAGLASEDTREDRAHEDGPVWMDREARRHHVELVMIYPEWFPATPQGWLKLGTLTLAGPALVLGGSRVAFYATTREAAASLSKSLPAFAALLPSHATFARDGASRSR